MNRALSTDNYVKTQDSSVQYAICTIFLLPFFKKYFWHLHDCAVSLSFNIPCQLYGNSRTGIGQIKSVSRKQLRRNVIMQWQYYLMVGITCYEVISYHCVM